MLDNNWISKRIVDFLIMKSLGKSPVTKSDDFLEKYVADFGNFTQGFLIMKLIQNSNF